MKRDPGILRNFSKKVYNTAKDPPPGAAVPHLDRSGECNTVAGMRLAVDSRPVVGHRSVDLENLAGDPLAGIVNFVAGFDFSLSRTRTGGKNPLPPAMSRRILCKTYLYYAEYLSKRQTNLKNIPAINTVYVRIRVKKIL